MESFTAGTCLLSILFWTSMFSESVRMTRILNLAEAATCSHLQPLARSSHLSSYLQPLAPKHIFLWLLFLFFSWGKPLKHANMLILCVNQVTMSCFTAVHRLDHGLEPLIWQPTSIQKVCRALLGATTSFPVSTIEPSGSRSQACLGCPKSKITPA